MDTTPDSVTLTMTPREAILLLVMVIVATAHVSGDAELREESADAMRRMGPSHAMRMVDRLSQLTNDILSEVIP